MEVGGGGVFRHPLTLDLTFNYSYRLQLGGGDGAYLDSVNVPKKPMSTKVYIDILCKRCVVWRNISAPLQPSVVFCVSSSFLDKVTT